MLALIVLGTLEIRGSNLTIAQNGTWTGLTTVDEGSYLLMNSGSQQFLGDSNIAGNGTVIVGNSATATFDSCDLEVAQFQLNGGSATLIVQAGAQVHFAQLTLVNGLVIGPSATANVDDFIWAGGDIEIQSLNAIQLQVSTALRK